MASTRQRRVQELLVKDISEIIRRELKDPDVGFVTITDAEVTPDLRHARVFFSVLGNEAQRVKTGKALNRAAGFIRSQFAHRAQLRFVPDLKFEFDSALEQGMRITELLAKVKQDDEEAGRVAEPGGSGDPDIA
jgi:ribosome-binding factor A